MLKGVGGRRWGELSSWRWVICGGGVVVPRPWLPVVFSVRGWNAGSERKAHLSSEQQASGRAVGHTRQVLTEKKMQNAQSALQEEEQEIRFGGFFSLAGFLVSSLQNPGRWRGAGRSMQPQAYDWLGGTSCLSKQLSELWHISADWWHCPLISLSFLAGGLWLFRKKECKQHCSSPNRALYPHLSQTANLNSQVSVWMITHSDSRKETGQDAFKTPHVLNQDKHNLESYSEGTLKMD